MKSLVVAAVLTLSSAFAQEKAPAASAGPEASPPPADSAAASKAPKAAEAPAAKKTGKVSKEPGAVVITVGPNKIQRKQIETMLDQLTKAKEAMGGMQPGERDAMKKMIATNLIGQELLELEAKRLNVKADEKEIDSLYAVLRANFKDEAKFKSALKEGGNTEKTFREKIARQVRHDKLLTANTPPLERPTMKEILDYFAANKAVFPIHDSLRACQIVFLAGKGASSEEASRKKADLEKVRAELGRDSADPEMLLTRFVVAARQVSEGPEKKDGGDLQRFKPDDFFPEFKKQVSVLRVGQMSPVFRTPLGWHLVLLTEKFDGKPDSYRLAIARMIAAGKSAAAGKNLRKYLQSLAAKYQVKYLEAAYKDNTAAGVYNL